MTPAFNPTWIVAGIGLLMLLGQAVGFVYLTRNHLTHLQEALDTLVAQNVQFNTRLSRIEGRLGIDTPISE